MNGGLSPEAARRHAEADGFPEAVTRRAAQLAVTSPDGHAWRWLVAIASGALGAGLFASGVVTFFAYNWQRLGPGLRLGLIEVLIVAAVVASARFWGRLGGRIALTLAAVLVGTLLAVYGQTYQTGADPYELFLTWALLVTPWAVVARFEPLWLLATAVLEVGVVLASRQRLGITNDQDLSLVVWALNAVAGAVWELKARLSRRGLEGRWLPRVWGFAAAVPLAFAVVAYIFDDRGDPRVTFGTLALSLASAVAYRGRRLDLFMLMLVVLLAMVTLTSFAARTLVMRSRSDFGEWLIMALFVAGQVAAGVAWLRHEARRAREVRA